MKTCLRRRRTVVLEELPGKSGANVTFNLDCSSFHEIDHLTDMSDEHIQSVWYSHEDYKEIKHSIKPIVREMVTYNGVIPEESDEFSSRGLECRTKLGSRSKARARVNAIQSVLEEQAIQQDEGLPDPDFIAEIYMEFTGVSAIEALNRGLKDQKFVLDGVNPLQQLERESRSKKLGSPKPLPLAKKRRASMTHILPEGDLQSLEAIPTL